jgi:hypothetical protein
MRAFRNRGRPRLDCSDPAAIDDHCAIVSRRSARPIDHPHMLESDQTGRHADEGSGDLAGLCDGRQHASHQIG